jgi:hypothetical protein
MPKGAIALTPEEQILLQQVTLRVEELDGHEHYQRNAELAVKLFTSVRERSAIPPNRWKWFFDPKYNPGSHGKSRYERFRNNCPDDDDIVRHPNFLAVIDYFINGARLTPGIISSFGDTVNQLGMISSSDVIPLGKAARQLTRDFGEKGPAIADEFYKLSLDLGLGPNYAESVMRQVRQVK